MTLDDLINIIIGLSLPIAVGYALVHLLCRHVSLRPLPALAIAYGLGTGILSQIMLLLGMMDIPYSRWTIGSLLFLTLPAITMPLMKKNKSAFARTTGNPGNNLSVWETSGNPPVALSPGQKIFCLISLLYIFYNILFVFWRIFNVPVGSWDAVATVSFKAKIFFFDRTLRDLALPHISYPLHVSFQQAWLALNLGRWHDTLIDAVLPLTFFAYLTLHYYFLKSRTSVPWALGGLCLVLASNFFVYHATIPYADFSMMYYNCTTIILLLTWHKTRHPALLLLASLFAGLTTFVKLEGTIYLGLHTALLVLLLRDMKTSALKEKWSYFLAFVLPSYGIASIFHLYKIITGITGMEGRLSFTLAPDHLQRFPAIMENLGGTCFLSGNWNMLWVLLAAGLLSSWPKIKQDMEIRLLVLLLGMFFAAYFIFFASTQTHIDYYNTLSRVMLHFFPLVTWLIILIYYPARDSNGETAGPD